MNVVGGLLAAAAILSLVLGRWDILIGVTLGLVTVVAADLFACRSNQTDEPRKWPDLSHIDDTGRTTCYYDHEDTLSASGAGDNERGLQSDLVENDGEGNRPR